MGVALSGGRLRCLAWRNVACYGNIDFIWNIEYSWREEGGDCTDDSRSIARHFCCDIDDSSLSEQ